MTTSYDIVRIKAQLPALSELLEKDGHQLRRAGTSLFARCPFHEEKSASLNVNDTTGRFHCFGCGASGDAFDYWQKSRGLSFQDSLAQLAGIAGVGPQVTDTGWIKPAAKPAKAEEKLPDPMTGEALSRWHASCDSLLRSERAIERIAEWRGIDREAVRYLASRGLMGSHLYWGSPREAFLVEMPSPSGLLPVSVHIRLAPGTKGNEQPGKASWRFEPSKCGSWPFLIGDLATADHVFLMEGQWDAIALVSIMGWHLRPEWPKVAVVGLRGATSGAKLLQHEINPKAQLFAIADADGGGASWFHNKGDIIEMNGKETEIREDGILTKLHSRFRSVTAFWPTTSKCDFNDLVKSGEIDRPLMLAFLQPLMRDPKIKSKGPTFSKWCAAKTKAPDPIGAAARFVVDDKTKPKGRRPLRAWEGHWRKMKVPSDLFGDLSLAWTLYRTECP